MSERRYGTKRLYQVGMEGLVPVKEFLEEFWDERLARLKDEPRADPWLNGEM